MSRPIEGYGLIGNMRSCALVDREGSIDWFCAPRFDSDACFAALLGGPEHGYWRIAPRGGDFRCARRYLPGTPILETTFENQDGAVSVTDFMPLHLNGRHQELVRLVRGVSGRVAMRMELVLRFGYGRTVPWVRRRDYGLRAVAGPDAIDLVTPAALRGENMKTLAEFEVAQGESMPFTLSYHPYDGTPGFIDDRELLLERTTAWWRQWSERRDATPGMPPAWQDAVTRSLVTLKTLTFEPTGGLVAAPTTSLPEQIGGERNWDYRFCWIRDATMTLYALLNCRYFEEAGAFREWLLRAAAGRPDQMQIMYGLGGERRLTEIALPWLPGYAGSSPVRVGNAAHDQLQIDVYGQLMDALDAARRSHLGPYRAAWRLQCVLLENLERIWREPDEGIWEVRSGRRHFTYSKVMAWAAFDRGIRAVEQTRLEGPADRWRKVRDEIRADILANGFDSERNTFVQHYGTRNLDASLLLLAEVGFLKPDDPSFRGTVEAVERDLMCDGFLRRYRHDHTDDGLPGSEGAFLICSFWLVDAYVLLRRHDDAEALFERLLAIRNDLGLLAEEFDPQARRFLGNFPQAFSHVGLINAAHNLAGTSGPSHQRANRDDPPESHQAPKHTKPSPMDEE